MNVKGRINLYLGTADESLQRPQVPRPAGHFGDELREREPPLRGALLKKGSNLVGQVQDRGHTVRVTVGGDRS